MRVEVCQEMGLMEDLLKPFTDTEQVRICQCKLIYMEI